MNNFDLKKYLSENKLTSNSKILAEEFNIKSILRKLGWAGETWTPQELASQIKKLDDSTLVAWSKGNKGIPNTPLAFQMKIVKAEMGKRGLEENYIPGIPMSDDDTWKFPLDYEDFTVGDKVTYLGKNYEVIEISPKSITIKNIDQSSPLLGRTYTLTPENGGPNGIYPVSIQKFGGEDRKY